MYKTVIKPILVLFAICLVASVILGLTNLLTAATIKMREEKAQNDALHLVLDAEKYEPIEIKDHPDATVYKAVAGEKAVGFCIVETKKGYGGDVKTVIGIKDGKITAVTVTDVSNETAGIGKRVAEDSHTSQFSGKSSIEGITAVSGATYSSKAVKEAVSEALTIYGEVAGVE